MENNGFISTKNGAISVGEGTITDTTIFQEQPPIIQFMDSHIIVYNDKRGGIIIEQGNQVVICDGGSVDELIAQIKKANG